MKKVKITLTNAELANAYRALQAIAGKVAGIVSRFRLAENVKSFEGPHGTWMEKYDEIVKKNVEHDEEGKPIVVEDDYVWKTEEGEKELKELNKITVEVTYTPLSLERLEIDLKKGTTVDYMELMPLLPLIADDVGVN